jgi:hypothetical protein
VYFLELQFVVESSCITRVWVCQIFNKELCPFLFFQSVSENSGRAKKKLFITQSFVSRVSVPVEFVTFLELLLYSSFRRQTLQLPFVSSKLP